MQVIRRREAEDVLEKVGSCMSIEAFSKPNDSYIDADYP